METILFLAHVESDGSLPKAALEALAAAQLLATAQPGGDLVAALVGATTGPAAEQIAGCGAKRFLTVSGPEYGQSRYASDAAAAEALCRAAQASVVVAPATSRFNRVLAGVAHRLQGRVDTHVTGLTVKNGLIEATRWYYRQRIEVTLQRKQRPWVILVDPGCGLAWNGARGSVNVEAVQVSLTEALQRTKVTGVQAPAADAQTIRPDAPLLFVAGAGWTKKQPDGQTHLADAEKLISGFLRLTRASLGSSKSLVDLSGRGRRCCRF